MRPWIKRTLIALFGASLVAAGVAACGYRHHDDNHARWSVEDVAKWRGKLLDRTARELQLDAAQQQRLGVLFDKMNEQRSALLGSTTHPRAALAELMTGEKFDRARAAALVEEKTGALRGKSPEVIAAAGDFYDSLKPEQQAKLREFLSRRDRHGYRHGDRGGDRHS